MTDLRADTPLCRWCARGEHDYCQRANRNPCPCYCRVPAFLNHYGLANAVACWLIAKAPEIVAMGPSALYAHDRPPRCTEPREDGKPCGEPMRLRPGYWKCFQHAAPVALKVRPEYDRAPDGDVLSLLTKGRRHAQ